MEAILLGPRGVAKINTFNCVTMQKQLISQLVSCTSPIVKLKCPNQHSLNYIDYYCTTCIIIIIIITVAPTRSTVNTTGFLRFGFNSWNEI